MDIAVIQQVILVAHLLLALAITGLIMLQQGKGAEMGASFGAGASQTLFGSSGSGNVLTRATAWLVALFFATSFGLAILAKQRMEGQDAVPVLPAELEAATQQIADDAPALDAAIDDLPLVEDSEPALSADDLPAADDIPELPEQ
uniref:Protein-export membrane protein SecG n=1 Tax=Haliea sp. ETY-M TaxID=1055105 RepID=A0A455R3L9_9GAMM|nr:preprotein translocase subunit SecG [Haliea sp. ETY-M]